MEIGRIPATRPSKKRGDKVQEVDTTLPSDQTVTGADQSDSVPLEFQEIQVTSEENNAEAALSERVYHDQHTHERRKEIKNDRYTSALMFRAIDASTGESEGQYPEEARQNIRAYLDKMSK